MQPSKSPVRLPIWGYTESLDQEIPLTALFTPVDDAPVAPRASNDRPLRTSSYIIRANLDTPDGEVLLIHGYSGAYDKVSRRVAAYLQSREAAAPAPLHGTWGVEQPIDVPAEKPSEEIIKALTKRGYLTTMTIEEEQALFSRVAVKLHARSMRLAPEFVVMPTYSCNLRCPYCFQDHMRTDPTYRRLLATMSTEVVDRMVMAMEKLEALHGVAEDGSRTVVLFGGEPLLAEHRPVVEYILRRAGERRRTRFSAVSNGTELDAYADLLGKDGISLLQITVDGVAAIHDRLRVYPGGAGSFERIAENITLALHRGARLKLRVNVSRANIDGLPALASEITDRGWASEAGFSAGVTPVYRESGGPDTIHSWELVKLLDEMKKQSPEVSIFHHPNDSMKSKALSVVQRRRDPLPDFTASACTAHSTMYVFDPFADIYACWERTGDPDIRIGRVAESGEVLMRKSAFESWRSRSVVSNPVCRQCRYALYCGGGCAAHAEAQNGSIHSNHCDSYAQRFRASAIAAYNERGTAALRRDDIAEMCGV